MVYSGCWSICIVILQLGIMWPFFIFTIYFVFYLFLLCNVVVLVTKNWQSALVNVTACLLGFWVQGTLTLLSVDSRGRYKTKWQNGRIDLLNSDFTDAILIRLVGAHTKYCKKNVWLEFPFKQNNHVYVRCSYYICPLGVTILMYHCSICELGVRLAFKGLVSDVGVKECWVTGCELWRCAAHVRTWLFVFFPVGGFHRQNRN